MRPPSDPILDLDRFAATPLIHEPFDYLVLPNFIPATVVAAVCGTFPEFDYPGLVPAPASAEGAFGRLLDAVRGPGVTEAFAAKFGLALWPESLMIALRGHCRARDGGIHAESESKLVTALIYLNPTWTPEGGRLRLLHGPDDLDDMIIEIPPLAGTLIAFRRSANSWHGHRSFEGVRRSITLNWMTSPLAARLETLRHGATARVKRLVG